MSFIRIKNYVFTGNVGHGIEISAWRVTLVLINGRKTEDWIKLWVTSWGPFQPELSLWDPMRIAIQHRSRGYPWEMCWLGKSKTCRRWEYKYSNVMQLHSIILAPLPFQCSNSHTFTIYRHIFKQCMWKDNCFPLLTCSPNPKTMDAQEQHTTFFSINSLAFLNPYAGLGHH